MKDKKNIKIPNSSPLIGFDKKSPLFYKGLRMKTDTRLHEQLINYIQSTLCSADNFKKMRILDWGCGEGAFSQRLHDLGFDVVSVDKDKRNYKAKGPRFYELDFNSSEAVRKFTAKHSNAFDIIFAIEVIEHVENPWNFLRVISSLCNKETQVIITTPNISSWWGRFWFLLKGELWGFSEGAWRDESVGHINPIGRIEMLMLLSETGFDCKKIWSGGCLPIIWFYNWKRFLISFFMLPIYLIMRGQKKGWVLCCHAVKKAGR